jgi:hypothetical protein
MTSSRIPLCPVSARFTPAAVAADLAALAGVGVAVTADLDSGA